MKKLEPVSTNFWKRKIHPLNRKVTEEFIDQSHFSPESRIQYKSILKQFFKWVYDHCENTPINELKPRHGLMYQNHINGLGMSAHSVRMRRSVVSSLCGFIEIYYTEEFPSFRSIFNKSMPNIPKTFKHDKKPLAKREIVKLTMELNKKKKLEMIAFVWFTYTTGCRRSEVAQLKKEVVHYEKEVGQNYYLTHALRAKGKGEKGNVRKVAFDDITKSYLKAWLEHRGEDDCPYVFPSTVKGTKQKCRPDRFNYMCKVFSRILEKRVHPHLFRGTRATHLIEDGVSIEAVRALLGHASIETTRGYIYKEIDDLENIF